jgi:hypothetical protein
MSTRPMETSTDRRILRLERIIILQQVQPDSPRLERLLHELAQDVAAREPVIGDDFRPLEPQDGP